MRSLSDSKDNYLKQIDRLLEANVRKYEKRKQGESSGT
jgi:hypothetical protein